MLPKVYAQALYQVGLTQKHRSETTFENLIAILKKKGHSTLLPQILREYEKLSHERQSSDRGVLEVARSRDVEGLSKEIIEACRKLAIDPEQLDRRENEVLVGGFLLRKRSEQIDASYRRKLIELYRSLVTA